MLDCRRVSSKNVQRYVPSSLLYKILACREKIIPAEPITVAEKKTTLQRLNQVIQHRLVSGEVMPQMRKFKVGVIK